MEKIKANKSSQTKPINIKKTDILPNDKTDHKIARQNLSFITELEVAEFEKIKQEPNLIKDMVVANSIILRTGVSTAT